MSKRLTLILVVGMLVALLPSFFTSEIEIGSITIRSERLFLCYWVVVMVVLGGGGMLEARRRIAVASRSRRWVKVIFLALIWAGSLAICGLVLWHLLRILITT
ncbi:MAG TPA: hypothetical protein VGG06_04290 [Thermoanaerobaculia bacterium]|jgi:hypothetical protein